MSINYDVHLYAGQIDGDKNITGDGYRIFFECWNEENGFDKYELPVGTYNAGEGKDMANFTFARGFDAGGGQIRSSQIREYNNGVLTVTAITEGRFEATRTGDIYTINVKVTTSDNRTIECTYTGAIPFTEMKM